MKIILSFCIVMIFFHLNTAGQVYQFTSDREVSVKVHSTDIKFEKKNISITIDLTNKRITLVRGQAMMFTIISMDTTLINKEDGKNFKCRCIDKEGSKHIIILMLYSDSIQRILGVAGTFAVSLGSEYYSYILYKK